MKQGIFTILVLTIIVAMSSCKKAKVYPNIKQYDQQQITAYMQSNNLTMKRDTAGGDTTGMYYQILSGPTSGVPMDYPYRVSIVFTVKTLDGRYVSTDTLAVNHFSNYLGHMAISAGSLPISYGLEIALKNIAKYPGTRMRLLVPSRLAFGEHGFNPSGGSSTLNNSIPGNESLDYYVNVISSEDLSSNASVAQATAARAAYDDIVIQNYIKANSLSGYTKTASGLYYAFTTPSAGTDPITDNSTVSVTYTGRLMNNTTFDSFTTAGGTAFNIIDLTEGAREGLKLAKAGATISLLVPSGLAYGENGSGTTVSANSCLRFEFSVLSVTP